MDIAALNQTFGINGQLEFTQGEGGFAIASISNPMAVARLSLYGAQVLSYRPSTETDDLLFNSRCAHYEEGKAIKGGIPICWPWFGPDPDGLSRPAHGFARNSHWQLLETGTTPTGATCLRLGLTLNEQTRTLWKGEIEAQIEITIGDSLSLSLTTFNHSTAAIKLTQAFHTYFNTGDIAQTRVKGLESKTYLDKLDDGKEKKQLGEVIINEEVDRIYKAAGNDLDIYDTALQRSIHIQSSGSHSAVVWNPWRTATAKMADLDDNDFNKFICVETTNAGEDIVDIAPGENFTMAVKYSLSSESQDGF